MLLNELVRKHMCTCRMAAGLSQMQMAMRLCMDERNYKRIESGERKQLDLLLVEQFCEVLQIPVTRLLGFTDKTPTHEEIIRAQWEIIKSQRNVMDTLHRLAGTADAQ